MPLSDFNTERQRDIILSILSLAIKAPVSALQVAHMIYGGPDYPGSSGIYLFMAGEILDELWDMDLCVCMGEPNNWDYMITTKGKQTLKTRQL